MNDLVSERCGLDVLNTFGAGRGGEHEGDLEACKSAAETALRALGDGEALAGVAAVSRRRASVTSLTSSSKPPWSRGAASPRSC